MPDQPPEDGDGGLPDGPPPSQAPPRDARPPEGGGVGEGGGGGRSPNLSPHESSSPEGEGEGRGEARGEGRGSGGGRSPSLSPHESSSPEGEGEGRGEARGDGGLPPEAEGGGARSADEAWRAGAWPPGPWQPAPPTAAPYPAPTAAPTPTGAGLPPDVVFAGGPRPARRFRPRAVVFALVGGIVLGLVIAVLGILTVTVVFPEALAPGSVSGTHGVMGEGAGPDVGDCLLPTPGDADVTSRTDVVDCRERHGSEVIGIARLPEVEAPPEDIDVDTFADGACRLAYRDYVGGNYDTSPLVFGAVVPGDEAYADGERAVYCLIHSRDHHGGEGSVRNTG